MTRKTRKLTLNRETLRHLDASQLGRIAGGTATWVSCDSCICGNDLGDVHVIPNNPELNLQNGNTYSWVRITECRC